MSKIFGARGGGDAEAILDLCALEAAAGAEPPAVADIAGMTGAGRRRGSPVVSRVLFTIVAVSLAITIAGFVSGRLFLTDLLAVIWIVGFVVYAYLLIMMPLFRRAAGADVVASNGVEPEDGPGNPYGDSLGGPFGGPLP